MQKTGEHKGTHINHPTLLRGCKTFFVLNSIEHEFQLFIKTKMPIKSFLAFKQSDGAFIMLSCVEYKTDL